METRDGLGGRQLGCLQAVFGVGPLLLQFATTALRVRQLRLRRLDGSLHSRQVAFRRLDLGDELLPPLGDLLVDLVLGGAQVPEDVLDEAGPQLALDVVPGVELDLHHGLEDFQLALRLAGGSRAFAVMAKTRRCSACMKKLLPEPQSPNRPTASGGLSDLAASR